MGWPFFQGDAAGKCHDKTDTKDDSLQQRLKDNWIFAVAVKITFEMNQKLIKTAHTLGHRSMCICLNSTLF